MAFLHRNLKNTKGKEKLGYLLVVLGGASAVLGFGGSFVYSGVAAFFLLGIIGLILAISGSVEAFYYSLQKAKSLEELKRLG